MSNEAFFEFKSKLGLLILSLSAGSRSTATCALASEVTQTDDPAERQKLLQFRTPAGGQTELVRRDIQKPMSIGEASPSELTDAGCIDPELIAPRPRLTNSQMLESMVEGDTVDQKIDVLSKIAVKTLDELENPLGRHMNTDRRMVLLLRCTAALEEAGALPENCLLRNLKNDALAKYLMLWRPLISSFATPLARLNNCFTVDDLVSEGQLGLMEALGRFDLANTNSLVMTFCRSRIHGAILDVIRSKGAMIRLSRRDCQRVMRIREVLDSGRVIDWDHLANELGCSGKALQRSQYYFFRAGVASFEGLKKNYDDDDRVIDVVADESYDVEAAVLRDLAPTDADKLAELLEELPSREATILRMRCGFYPYEYPHKMKQIGDYFGFTESRATQIVSQTIKSLRGKLKAEF